MPSDKKTLILLHSKKASLISSTPKIIYNHSTQPIFFIDDLFTTYSKISNDNCFFTQFIDSLQESNEFTLCISKSNMKHSIVSPKEKANRSLMIEIIKELEQGRKVEKENSQSGNRENDNHIPTTPVPTVQAPARNNFYDEIFNNEETLIQPKKSGSSIFDKKKMVQAFEDLDDDSSNFYDDNKVKKAKVTVSTLPTVSTAVDQFDKLQDRLIETFGNNPVIPSTAFMGAMSQKFGMAFDPKSHPCKIPKHKHKNLKMFLYCCNSFIKIVTNKDSYIVCKTLEMIEINKKRLLTYGVKNTHPKYKYFMELLITSMFTVKVTIPFIDLSVLFEEVYGKKLEEMINNGADSGSSQGGVQLIKKFLCSLKSQNILVLQGRDSISLTISPFEDEKFKQWDDTNIFDEVMRMEKEIDKVCIEGTEQKINVSAGEILVEDWNKIVRGESKKDKILIQMIRIADLNIPKRLQRMQIERIGRPYSDIWMYLKTNVNFETRRENTIDRDD